MTDQATTTPDGMRRCSGSPAHGIPAHDAPPSAFSANKSGPGGLNRRCRECWQKWRVSHYHGGDPAAPRRVPAQAKGAGGRKAADGQPGRKAATPAPAVVDATEQQAAEHAALEAQLAENGGAGTDQSQALLAQAADDAAAARRAADAERKRRERAAKKAAQQA